MRYNVYGARITSASLDRPSRPPGKTSGAEKFRVSFTISSNVADLNKELIKAITDASIDICKGSPAEGKMPNVGSIFLKEKSGELMINASSYTRPGLFNRDGERVTNLDEIQSSFAADSRIHAIVSLNIIKPAANERGGLFIEILGVKKARQ